MATFVDAQTPPTQEDLKREAAIAEFTRKQKEANYPALFEQAAKEFNVPADVLKAVAFAETRWEHLTWPAGETVSPATGKPRPYGIMSLWDNDFFGHSLVEAAALIGKQPDDLKNDPLQNIRGAAALLRKLYDQDSKPSGTTETDIESWRYAIRKYCGIPEPDLNARHALKVYTFMNEGYHQYGIEWDARPVNLEPIQRETAQIVAQEESRRKLAQVSKDSTSNSPVPELRPSSKSESEMASNRIVMPPPAPESAATPASERKVLGFTQHDFVWFVGGALVAVLFFLTFFQGPKKPK